MNPTRLYLERSNNILSPLLWFHNFKINEMMLGIYGLNHKQPFLTLEFPEYILPDSKLNAINYKYKDATQVNKQLDHITCHNDGKFHLRTKNDENDRYIHGLKSNTPLGPDVPIFLQFQIISDITENYKITKKSPKNPYVLLQISDNECLSLRGAFSGINFDLKKEIAQTLSALNNGNPFSQPAIVLNSNSLQGIFFWQKMALIGDAKKNRPAGTIVSFMFNTENGENLIKTFIFE